jgi:hypothetical protein
MSISISVLLFVLLLGFRYNHDIPIGSEHMARILLLIVLIAVLYFIAKRFIAFLNAKQDPPIEPSAKTQAENIVQCTLCGTHIPESESMLLESKIVCKQQPCKYSV